MTDLNKPVEITHDPVTGDIASIHQYPYSTSKPMTVDEVRVGANRRIWQGREIENDMLISPAEFQKDIDDTVEVLDKMESEKTLDAMIAEDQAKVGSQLDIEAVESKWDEDDWWSTQEHFGAPLTPAEQVQVDELHADLKANALKKYSQKSFIQKETEAIMARVTANVTPATAHFKKIGDATQKTTTAFKELGEKIGQVKKDYHDDPRAPMTHRPFHTKALAQFRETLNS